MVPNPYSEAFVYTINGLIKTRKAKTGADDNFYSMKPVLVGRSNRMVGSFTWVPLVDVREVGVLKIVQKRKLYADNLCFGNEKLFVAAICPWSGVSSDLVFIQRPTDSSGLVSGESNVHWMSRRSEQCSIWSVAQKSFDLFIKLDLSVSTDQIQCGKILGAMRGVNGIANPRKKVSVYCSIVERSSVTQRQ